MMILMMKNSNDMIKWYETAINDQWWLPTNDDNVIND